MQQVTIVITLKIAREFGLEINIQLTAVKIQFGGVMVNYRKTLRL